MQNVQHNEQNISHTNYFETTTFFKRSQKQ